MVTPSAIFLQMYFCLLSHEITSHNPAETPVCIATHPWCLSEHRTDTEEDNNKIASNHSPLVLVRVIITNKSADSHSFV